MDQQALFKLAVDAVSMTAGYEHGRGWWLHLMFRRGHHAWADAEVRHFECLTADELLDALEGAVTAALGL